jgi:hypothetical protein
MLRLKNFNVVQIPTHPVNCCFFKVVLFCDRPIHYYLLKSQYCFKKNICGRFWGKIGEFGQNRPEKRTLTPCVLKYSRASGQSSAPAIIRASVSCGQCLFLRLRNMYRPSNKYAIFIRIIRPTIRIICFFVRSIRAIVPYLYVLIQIYLSI